MKKTKKIICVLLIFLLAIVIHNIVFAESATEAIFSDPNLQSVKDGLATGDFDSESGIGGAINTIIGLMQVAGTGVSIIVVTMLGIKYILASVEEKAEIKKQAMPIVIGCVLLFGAVQIIAIVEDFANKSVNAS